MILVYIENKAFLTKIISYFDSANISYTTDLNVEYEYILIGESSKKVMNFIDSNNLKNKKIIYITYLDEDKILNNKINDKLISKCYKIIVSLPSIKNILKKKTKNQIEVIEKEIPIINISKSNSDIYNKYKISKRKKKILVFDFDYNNIDIVYDLALNYPKYNFIYVGFKVDYLIKNKSLELLYKMPNNVSFVKYYDFNILSDLAKICFLVINFEENINIEYLYMVILFKKQLLMIESKKYEDYLINSKNSYIFKDNKELKIRFNKIIDGRVANLTDNAYMLIKDNIFSEIIKKIGRFMC